jgi:hypothetical protein
VTNAIGGLIVLAALGLSVFGLVDAARRPEAAWVQVGQSKVLWVVLLAISILLDFLVFGVIISILYLVIARAKLNQVGTATGAAGWGSTPYGGPTASGGYPPGPWDQATGASPGASWPAANPGSPPPPEPGSPAPAAPDPGTSSGSPVAGWYGDPGGSGQKRYWDGRAWTNELRP